MLSSPGAASPRPGLFPPHHGGFYWLGSPAAPACATGKGEVGRTPFASFPLSRCCVSQPLLRFLPSKKVWDTRYHLCEVWTESQMGISFHHYSNSASRRKAMTRKENTHLLLQSASLLPPPLVGQMSVQPKVLWHIRMIWVQSWDAKLPGHPWRCQPSTSQAVSVPSVENAGSGSRSAWRSQTEMMTQCFSK